MRIAGSSIVVTGASSGIGAALAPLLAARGATVGLVARRRDRLEAVLQQCRSHAPDSEFWAVDLGDLSAAATVASAAEERWGRVDCIVNNAAIPKRVPFTRLTMHEVEETMRVNFLSPAQLTLALLPGMLQRRHGLIVNVSSTGGRIPIANESAYNASKYALAGWSEAMRLDLEGTGVGVKLILPGPIATEIWEQPGNDPAVFDVDKVPALECAEGIAEAIESDGFEYYVPPVFPGGMDVKELVVNKTQHCDRYLDGMAQFVASLRADPAGDSAS
jgi:short-subunit dehydrogenase